MSHLPNNIGAAGAIAIATLFGAAAIAQGQEVSDSMESVQQIKEMLTQKGIQTELLTGEEYNASRCASTTIPPNFTQSRGLAMFALKQVTPAGEKITEFCFTKNNKPLESALKPTNGPIILPHKSLE